MTLTGSSVRIGDAVFYGDGGNMDGVNSGNIGWVTSTSGIRVANFSVAGYESKPKLPEGVEMMTLFEVYRVYAEDAKNPNINGPVSVLARDEEEAKLKANYIIDTDWDTDYLTILAVRLGDVKVKAKPQEVKQV